MKKIVIAATTLCFLAVGANAQQEGQSIKFFNGTVAETLSEAKKTNKLVFIDCYTSWCGPCKKMDKYVFTNDTVAAYFNNTFVNYKMDMEKGEGVDVGRLYKVLSYPTYLFLDGDGKVVHRSAGAMPAAEFIALARKTSNPAETSLAIEERYASGDRSPEFLLKYIAVLKRSNVNKARRVYDEHLTTLSDKDLQSEVGWEIIKLYPLSGEDRLYKFLVSHESYFVSKYGKEEVGKIHRQIELRAMSKALFTKDKENFISRLAIYRKTASAEELRTAARMELVFYIVTKDYPVFIDLAKQHSQGVLKTDDRNLSFVAHYCDANSDDKGVLQQALAMAKQAVMINDKVYMNQRSYADLCYKLGLKEEALKAARIALQLIIDENPKAGKLTEELIEKIQVM